MTIRSYKNKLNQVEVSIAIERLLVADYPTVWTPSGKVDFQSPPSGFRDLGAVMEDSASFKVTREKFMLDAGIPKVRQFEAVTGLQGEFGITLHSNNWRKVQYAFGNYAAVSSAVSVASVSSVHSDGLTFVLSTTPTTPLAVGQQIVLSDPADFDAADALEVRIGSITTGDLVYTISHEPYKPLETGQAVGLYSHVIQNIGGRAIRYYSILGVADFIDGVQVVHEMRKVSPAGDWEEALRPDQNGRIPITFNALGFDATIGGCTELVIARRHYFSPQSNEC